MPYKDKQKNKECQARYRKEHAEELAEYYKRHDKSRPDKGSRSRRSSQMKYYYGISLEDYEEMESNQGCKCAICGKFNDTGKRLFIDHNHSTGKVRALLCGKCNSMIGYAYENIATLKSAIQYLEKFNA